MDNIQKMFYDDIKEKKMIGRNVKYRKNRVYSDVIYLPSDYLSKKQLEKMNGEVVVSNLFDDLTYEELKKLTDEQKLGAIEYLSKKFGGRKQLAEHWGVGVQSLHDLVYRLRHKLEGEKKMDDKIVKVKKEKKVKEPVQEPQKPEVIDSGFVMRLIGEMTGDEFQERITNIATIVMKGKKYQISFELKEIKE